MDGLEERFGVTQIGRPTSSNEYRPFSCTVSHQWEKNRRVLMAEVNCDWSLDLATIKKGILVSAGEWWKHLRWTKRSFWKRHRKAERRETRKELRDVR